MHLFDIMTHKLCFRRLRPEAAVSEVELVVAVDSAVVSFEYNKNISGDLNVTDPLQNV